MDSADKRHICRTCMAEAKQNQALHFLYDPATRNSTQSVADLLLSTIPRIYIQLEDELPKNICIHCLDTLVKLADFQRMCLHTQRKLFQLMCTGEVAQSSNTAASITEITPQTDPLAFEIKVFEDLDVLQNNDRLLKEVEDEDIIGEESSREVVEKDAEGYHTELTSNCEIEKGLDAPIETSPLSPSQVVCCPDILDSAKVHTGSTATNRVSYEDHDTNINPTEQTGEILKGSKYVCEHCNKVFRTSIRLQEHLRVQTADCKEFKKSSDLSRHLKCHTRIKSYKCSDCTATFTGLRDLCTHKKVHVKGKSHTCDVCGIVFLKQYHLKQHSVIHKGEPSFKCEYCDKRFHFIDGVQKHQRTHTGEKPYNCKYCDRTFRYSNQRNTHLRTHLGENIYKCNLCPQKFPLLRELRQHLALHEKHDEDKEQSNDEVDETMSSENESEDETGEQKKVNKFTKGQSTDKETKDLVCGYCDEVFQKRRALRIHMRIHIGEKPCLCSECGKVFTNTHNLKQHLLRHTSEKNLECPECPKKFRCHSDLHSHKIKHAKIKSHVCDLCGSGFVTWTELKVHRMRHTGEKPHQCGYCEKRFVVAEHMRRHQRTHTGEKPYKCQYCTMAYAQSNDLIKHLRIHLGENVYRCELCPQRFRLARDRREHFATHKNDDEATRLSYLKALQEDEAKFKANLMSANDLGRRINDDKELNS